MFSNKAQLSELIRRSRNGLVLADVRSCYEGVEADVMSMIVGGDIIAVHNKVEFKSLILYPRGRPFLTKLSGAGALYQCSMHSILQASMWISCLQFYVLLFYTADALAAALNPFLALC